MLFFGFGICGQEKIQGEQNFWYFHFPFPRWSSRTSDLPQYQKVTIGRTHESKKKIMEEILENHNMGKQDVEIPMERTENVMKLNRCNQCKYASSFKCNLRAHMKTNSGEKTNKCNQCDYTSSQAGNLRTHLKTHSGEKSNKCNHCDYATAFVSALRRHLKTHRGEKANKCTWGILDQE